MGYSKEYYAAHREEIAAKMRAYNLRTSEKRREYAKRYYRDNKNSVLMSQAAWANKPINKLYRKMKYALLPPEEKARRVAMQRAWRDANRERWQVYYKNKRSKFYIQREMLS
jgi:hypothetical protein